MVGDKDRDIYRIHDIWARVEMLAALNVLTFIGIYVNMEVGHLSSVSFYPYSDSSNMAQTSNRGNSCKYQLKQRLLTRTCSMYF